MLSVNHNNFQCHSFIYIFKEISSYMSIISIWSVDDRFQHFTSLNQSILPLEKLFINIFTTDIKPCWKLFPEIVQKNLKTHVAYFEFLFIFKHCWKVNKFFFKYPQAFGEKLTHILSDQFYISTKRWSETI